MWCIWLCHLYFINLVFRLKFKALYPCLFNFASLNLAWCQIFSWLPLQSCIAFTISWHLLYQLADFIMTVLLLSSKSMSTLFMDDYYRMTSETWNLHCSDISALFRTSELRPCRIENPKDGDMWGKNIGWDQRW